VRITGLDLSLTGTGIATVERGVTFLQEISSKPTGDDLSSRARRLRRVAVPIVNACLGSDLVLVEDLYMGKGTGAQLDRAGLWWIVLNSLDVAGLPLVLVTNNHLKMYALGKGAGKGTDKDNVLAAVIRRYPTADVTSNNTADALVLAAMGARRLGCAIETDLPESHLRAMKAVRWPELDPARHGDSLHG